MNYKQQLLTCLLAIVGSMAGQKASAYVKDDGIYYDLNHTGYTATVINYDNIYIRDIKLGYVNIPESITYYDNVYRVTSIGSHAFEDCTYLNKVYIPKSVTSIGDNAFYGCNGNKAWDFDGLTSITIPKSVTTIGSSAFSCCIALTSIKVEEGNKTYDSRDNCNAIIKTATNTLVAGCKNTVIPNTVTSIGSGVFDGCSGLTSVTIPVGVTSIGERAFKGCTSLTSITIPSSVTSIGSEAFSNCSGLTSIKAKGGNSKYNSRNNCNAIIETATNTLVAGCQNTVIPNGVTSIGGSAFRGCSGLTSVTIPNSVTSIGSYAFSGCDGLTSVTLNSNYIVSAPRNSSTSMKSIFGDQVKEYIIGESVKSIGGYAFYDCSGLTSVTIGNGVTSIGGSAFKDCSGLTSVTLNNNYIVSASRESSTSMKSIFGYQVKNYIIGESVKSIGSGAFFDCGCLTSVTIPNSVTSIGEDAFFGCSGLTSIHISELETWCEIAFKDYYSNPLCYAHHLFLNGVEIKDLVIPNSVTSIPSFAFRGCSGLTSVTIPNSVTSIGNFAFSYCSGLTSIDIPNSVTSIGSKAFSGCSGLTSVTIGNGVISIGDSAFDFCRSLSTVTIGNGVTSIGRYTFSYCNSLTDVQCYAKNVPSTSDHLFYDSPIASATLHVPTGSVNAYSTTEPWSNFGNIEPIEGRIIENLSELSNNRQYLIHTRDEIRGSLGVTDYHLASTNPAAYGPWVCRPVVLDRNNPLITNVNQLSSPYTEPTEGSLAAMIDGDPGTFWHSVWSQGAVEAGSHYFQVKMPSQANIDVAFKVTRRQADNDHITEWGVYGTNNANASKANCTELAVITTPYKNRDETRVSEIFKTGGYKYLRFYINKTTRSNFGHLAEFQLYPATYDEEHGEASPFAIIQKDGGYYLYSVLDKAFITPVNNGDENANPLLPSDNKMNIYMYDDIHFVFDFIDTGYTINVNFDPGISISKYGTLTNKFDDGNLFTIEEVGNFDPTEALAKFETQTFTVTYKVMFDGKVVAKATEEVASGSPLPPAPASLYNDFVTLTKTGTHPATVTGDVTVTYNATWKGPFEFTKTVTNAKWYNMHIRSGYYVGKQESEPYYPTKNVDEATLAKPAYQWAFGGDPYHVKVYNRTTGLDETLRKDGDNAVMRAGEYTWDLLPNSDGFVLRVPGTEYSCINQYGSTSGPLQFWTNSKALTDDGSTFRVEEVIVPPSSDLVINDETTSLNIETEGSGRKVEFTHAFNGEWEALYLPFAIDYDAIKANFDLAEIDGVVQNDDNNDGVADITVLSIMGFKGQNTMPNTPYLIRAKNAGEQTLQFDDVTIYPTEEVTFDCSSFSTKYEFTGSYNTLNASALANHYVVQDGELVKGASSLAPCRWYMTATARKGSLNLPNRIRIMPVEDVITGVSPLGDTEEGAAIYNVSGQRLNKRQKGINIVGGKKALVK